MPHSESARAGGFRHQPSSSGPDETEAFVPRAGREGAGDPESFATNHRWLCARTLRLGLRAVDEHGRTMDTAHEQHRTGNPRKCVMSFGTEAQAYTGIGGARRWVPRKVEPSEVTQQAQNGQGHEMVEGFEQQTARATVDGSPAHQATTLCRSSGNKLNSFGAHLRRMAKEAQPDEGCA